MKAKKEKLLTEDVSTHFSVKNLLKDLTYTYELVRSIRKPAFLNAQVKEITVWRSLRRLQRKTFQLSTCSGGALIFFIPVKIVLMGKESNESAISRKVSLRHKAKTFK